MKTKERLPISVKAYNDFKARFNHVFNELSCDTKSYDEAIELFDRYINSGCSIEVKGSPIVVLAFSMIKSEVDKAYARSLAARKRASLRKEKQTHSRIDPIETKSTETKNSETSEETKITETSTETIISETSAERSIPEIPIRLSRRERRLMEMEQRRRLRKVSRKPFFSPEKSALKTA